MLDFYKASPIKRFVAYMIDMILLLIIAGSIVVGMFSKMNFTAYREELVSYYDKYEQQYGVDLSVSKDSLSEEDQQKYIDAFDALNNDKGALSVLSSMVKIAWLSLAVGLLVAYIILEVMLPLIFKNGQTVGKKAMGLCVMHKEHVKVSVMQVIYRAIVGKYFVETLVPITMILLQLSGTLGTTAVLILSAIVMIQGFIVLMSQANCGIHDKLFKTMVADFEQQYIFDTLEEKRAYEQELEEREAKYGG